MTRASWLAVLLVALAPAAVAADAGCVPVRLGVLDHRGSAITLASWQPTADYLSHHLPGHCFQVVPLPFAGVDAVVAAAAVEFVLVNPAIYVALEYRHGVARIATMRNGIGDAARNVFGGVVFTRADRADIQQLEDLAGRHLLAVAPTSFGGYLVGWGELLNHGIDPQRDLGGLSFAGTHDAVVAAVIAGAADAGTVRTDILEHLAAAGTVDLAAVRVLAPRTVPGFAPLLSTRLYPEWAFASLPQTPETLVEQVAIALLQMPRDAPAAQLGGYAGWTVPLDYQPAAELLRVLRQPPFDGPPPFTIGDALARYRPLALIWLALLVGLLVLMVRVVYTNGRLARANALLEERYVLILNSVAEGIYGVDRHGRTAFVNRAMAEMTGWAPEDLVGRDQGAVLHPPAPGAAAGPAGPPAPPMHDGRERFVDHELGTRRDGSSFPVEYRVTPVRDRRGSTIGSVVVCRDITERLEAAERIRRLERQQAHAARLSTLGEVTSSLAHELNQPLTSIGTNARACLRLVEGGRADLETCASVLERIASAADRAGEVIRHIRRFARKESPQTHPTPVVALFETALVLLRDDAQRQGVVLTCSVGLGVERVTAQQTQIEQVLVNLVHNGIEALAGHPEPRRLHLSARAAGERVVIRVRDNGPGIADELRERLFEPFITDKPGGLGLGLSISTSICTAHGDRLEVEDRPGGTCFRFSLPVARSGAGASHAAE